MKIEDKRREIDQVDTQIKTLFIKRMEIAKEIGIIKKSQGTQVEDKSREMFIIEKNSADVPAELKEYYKELLKKMIELSKEYQNIN